MLSPDAVEYPGNRKTGLRLFEQFLCPFAVRHIIGGPILIPAFPHGNHGTIAHVPYNPQQGVLSIDAISLQGHDLAHPQTKLDREDCTFIVGFFHQALNAPSVFQFDVGRRRGRHTYGRHKDLALCEALPPCLGYKRLDHGPYLSSHVGITPALTDPIKICSSQFMHGFVA